MEFWYQCGKLIGETYRHIFIPKLQINGLENIIPGPKIIVANHSYASDVFIIPCIVKDRLHFLVEEELLSIPFFGKILTWADQIPVAAGRGQEALATAYDRLRQGHTIVIFPEGRLSHGKEVQRARTGAIRLAMESGFPLLPFGIYTPERYTHSFSRQQFGRETTGGWQFGGSSFVAIGEAWPLYQDFKDSAGFRAFRQAADDLRARLERLVQQANELAQKYSSK